MNYFLKKEEVRILMKKKFNLVCLVLIILFAVYASSLAVTLRGNLPEVKVSRVSRAPLIDGEIRDDAWVQVACSFDGVLSGWKNVWGDGLITNPRISYLCYDADNLYIATIAFVGDTSDLKKQDWDSDGLEVHLDTGSSYSQVGIFFDGEKKTAFNHLHFDAMTYIDDYFWSVEVAIPWSELGIKPSSGLELRFNLSGWDFENGWVTWGPSYENFTDRSTFGYLALR